MGEQIDWKSIDSDEKLSQKINQIDKQVAINKHRMKAVEDKLANIDSNVTWLLRLVIGALVLAVLSLLIYSNNFEVVEEFNLNSIEYLLNIIPK